MENAFINAKNMRGLLAAMAKDKAGEFMDAFARMAYALPEGAEVEIRHHGDLVITTRPPDPEEEGE